MLNKRKIISKKDLPTKDRYLGVILEDMNGKFDLLIEGQQVTQKQVDSLERQVGSLGKKISDLAEQINYLGKRLDSFEKRFEDFQKETRDNFTAVFKYLSHLDETIRPLQKEIQKLKEEEWEKRLARLEEILLKRQ